MEDGDGFYNRVSGERITSRQIDELIGIARGLIADDQINQSEVEFLRKWLAANAIISDQPCRSSTVSARNSDAGRRHC